MKLLTRWSLVLTLLLSIAPYASAQVYKWVDEHGKVHYGDKPADEASQKMDIKKARKADQYLKQRQGKRNKLLRAIEEDRHIERQQQAREKQKRLQQEDRCRRARNNLEDYKRGGRVYELDKNGQRYFLKDEDFPERIKYWSEMVKRWCS